MVTPPQSVHHAGITGARLCTVLSLQPLMDICLLPSISRLFQDAASYPHCLANTWIFAFVLNYVILMGMRYKGHFIIMNGSASYKIYR